MNILMVGCGGVGSWLSHLLAKRVDAIDMIHFVDGDTVEEKNLERQMFRDNDIGEPKALIASSNWPGRSRNTAAYFDLAFVTDDVFNVILCCVDNNAARKDIFTWSECQETRPAIIVAANERTDAEAYIYFSFWQGGDRDPRCVYPTTFNPALTPDPRSRTTGCAHAVGPGTEQYALANFQAAAFAAKLLENWVLNYNSDIKDVLAYRYFCNEFKFGQQ